ncbi:MAG TPA: hypothetical protein VF518_01900 [Polyangia bacterium]
MRTLPIAASILLLASPRVFAGVPSTVAVAVDTSDINPKTAVEVQTGLEAEVAYGLAEVFSNFARVKVNIAQVSDPQILARIQICEDAECLQNVAKSAKVDLVVQVRVQAKKVAKKGKPEYAIHMVIARDAPTRDTWREKTDCQACGASEIKHMASLLASTIAGNIKIDTQPAVEPAPKAPEKVVKLAPPPVEMEEPSPPPAPEERGWQVPRWVSVTALVGGAALIGTGVYMLSIDGKGTCNLAASEELCARRHKTRGLGIGLLAGGGLAALGGLGGLIFFAPGSGAARLALEVTGSSISVGGTF